MVEERNTPLHLWIVGGLSLAWNALGGVDYTLTQLKDAAYLAQFSVEQKAFFASFPVWMKAFWAIGVWGAIAGSLLLLLRSRHAVAAFGLSLAGLAINSFWQFALSGVNISKVFGTGPLIMTALIWVLAIGLLIYARRQASGGVLR